MQVYDLKLFVFTLGACKNKIIKIMNELIEKIKELSAALLTDAELQATKGNKAAGTRARKASLDLEKVLKEFRKKSLEESKK